MMDSVLFLWIMCYVWTPTHSVLPVFWRRKRRFSAVSAATSSNHHHHHHRCLKFRCFSSTRRVKRTSLWAGGERKIYHGLVKLKKFSLFTQLQKATEEAAKRSLWDATVVLTWLLHVIRATSPVTSWKMGLSRTYLQEKCIENEEPEKGRRQVDNQRAIP